MDTHALRRAPGFTWCGLPTGAVLATPWAHEVTCGECIELIVEDMPERAIFFIEPLFEVAPALGRTQDGQVTIALPRQSGGYPRP